MKAQVSLFALILLLSPSLSHAQGSASTKKADSLFFIPDYKNAIPAYEAALKVAATNSVAWNRLAYSYQSIGQYDKALANYAKALENKPAPALEATIESRLSRIYAIRKDNESAIAHLQKAVTLGYVNLQELQTHKDFDIIRNDKRFGEMLATVNKNAFPCMSIPQAREFDFWVGEWDVYPNGTNTLVGHSKVEIASGGCMVLENWTALGPVPNTGKSMNYVNSTTGKWEQHWIGSGGLSINNPQLFTNGEYKDGAMRFESTSMSPQNQKQRGRFIFFNMEPDQVRQFYEISVDDGKTWTTSYDFIYKRKKG
jgi:tetratricopeptide (TPR) repeat protein